MVEPYNARDGESWDHSCDRCGCYWLVFWHQPTKDRRCYACRGYAAVGTPCETGHWRRRAVS